MVQKWLQSDQFGHPGSKLSGEKTSFALEKYIYEYIRIGNKKWENPEYNF